MNYDLPIDHGDLKKYRTEVPNIVFELGLHPLAVVIYSYIKRRAGGGEGGCCFMSNNNIAEKLGMTRPTFVKYRNELLKKHPLLDNKPLLIIQKNKREDGGNATNSIYIVDIWHDNFDFYREVKRNRIGVEDGGKRNNPPPETSQPGGGKPVTPKKEHIKKEHKEEEKESQPAEAAWRLSRFLFSKIQELDPKAKKPALDKWAEDIDKLIRIDGRDEEEISSIISWTFDDGFWCKTILSGRKLREKFNTLVIHKKKDKKTKSQIEDEAKHEKENLKQRNQKWLQEWIEKYHPKNLFEYANCVQIETSSGMASIGFLDDNFKNTIVNWTKQVFTGEIA